MNFQFYKQFSLDRVDFILAPKIDRVNLVPLFLIIYPFCKLSEQQWTQFSHLLMPI